MQSSRCYFRLQLIKKQNLIGKHLAGLSPTTIEDRNRGTRIDKTFRQ
jgi:hypothetical protein